jgi:hypothetical protein
MDYAEYENSVKSGSNQQVVETASYVPESQALQMLLDPERSIKNFRLAPNGKSDNWGEKGRFRGRITGSFLTETEVKDVDILVLGPYFVGRAVAKARRREPRVAVHTAIR